VSQHPPPMARVNAGRLREFWALFLGAWVPFALFGPVSFSLAVGGAMLMASGALALLRRRELFAHFRQARPLGYRPSEATDRFTVVVVGTFALLLGGALLVGALARQLR
jgi:hypothetical protein